MTQDFIDCDFLLLGMINHFFVRCTNGSLQEVRYRKKSNILNIWESKLRLDEEGIMIRSKLVCAIHHGVDDFSHGSGQSDDLP